MQTASSRNSTQFADSISYSNNHYTKQGTLKSIANLKTKSLEYF